jgi:hypothetical protein
MTSETEPLPNTAPAGITEVPDRGLRAPANMVAKGLGES